MSANTGFSEFGSDDLLIDLGDPTISADDLDEEPISRMDYEQDVTFEDEDGELEGEERFVLSGLPLHRVSFFLCCNVEILSRDCHSFSRGIERNILIFFSYRNRFNA
jgi:hypothetical protein